MKKKALIVTALAGFVRSFLINDIKLLKKWDMRYLVLLTKIIQEMKK